MSPRHLTAEEIQALEQRGCTAEDWSQVLVSDPFRVGRLARACFSGPVRLGVLEGAVAGPGGTALPCGIFDSRLHACTVGDATRIAGARRVANYDIGDGVVIEGVETLAVEGESAFGNGAALDVLNEGGGRTLRIFDRLSAPLACLMVLYRHDAALIERLDAMVARHVAARRSARGRIGDGCRIEGCGTLVNVQLGPATCVRGALELREGTVAGNREDPSLIGPGVIARQFIVLSGSRVEDGVILSHCFVGQGVRLGRQFSAENSVFFANCEGFHGEACSIFAGPYTVTHHKSTLLIAGLFSFYNAGSGTNQSNHMYKLGPIHQGIVLRGAKTGSFSYMLWPAVVGPFSVVLGKCMNNFDVGDLPFSYIQGEDGRTEVLPAMNLFTVGTRRDSAKWPARDRRKDPDRLDPIEFDLFSPFVMERVLRGMRELKDLYEKTPRERETVMYKGAQIARINLRTGVKYYELAWRIALGDCLAGLVEACGGAAAARERLAQLAGAPADTWVDLAGLLAPASRIDALCREVRDGGLENIDAIQERLVQIHEAYPEEKLRWFAGALTGQGIEAGQIRGEQMARILTDWRDARTKLNNMIAQDAGKEFDASASIGYGQAGGAEARAADFAAVRGTLEGNKFIKELRADSEQVAVRTQRLLELIAAD